MNMNVNNNKFNLSFTPATNMEAYQTLIQENPQDMIASANDLKTFYEGHSHFKSDNKFINAFQEFEKNVVFSPDGGFFSGDFSSLTENLTYRQLEELTSKMGMSMFLFECRKGSRCSESPPGSGIKRCVTSVNSEELCCYCDPH